MFRLKKFTMQNTIKSRLIVSFILILLVPSLVIGIVSYDKSKIKVEEQFTSSAQDNVRLINELVNHMVQSKINDVDILAERIQASQIAVQPGSNIGVSPEVSAILDQYQKRHPELELSYIGIENNGVYINSPADKKNPPDWDARQRPWYQLAMKSKGNVAIYGPYVSKATGNLVITITKTTADGQGAVAVNLALKSLDELVKKVKIGEEGYVQILDKDSKWVIHPTLEIGSELKGQVSDKVFAAESGQFSYTASDGQAKSMVFVTNKLTGWKLCGTWYTSEVTKAASDIFNTTFTVILVALFVGVFVVYLIIRSITRPLSQLMKATEKIGQGDLTETVAVKTQDELGQLASGFNQMGASLRSVLKEVNGTAVQLAASSEELNASSQQSAKSTEHIASSMQEIASGSDKQVRSVEESAKTVSELAEGIQQVAENTMQASDVAIQASSKSREGGKAVEIAVDQMHSISKTVNGLSNVVKGLGERSKEIGEILEVITGISAQTNLLALNAAIEAARAGEHGRGFAVVADEVRKLAEQSSQSAQKISDLIKHIQGETGEAVVAMEQAINEVASGLEVVQQAGVSFTEIHQFVDALTSEINGVSAASEQMAAGTQQVVQAIQLIAEVAEGTANGTQQVSASSQQQLASMEEISASAQSLSRMAEDLQGIVEKFKL